MHTTYRSTFTTLRIEGAILPPDLLQRIADGDAAIEGLTPEAYHLAQGEKLNEAINRAWNRLLGAWASFRTAADKLPETDAGTTVTRERWLLPLFSELGYGRLATAKAIEIEGQSYPVSHAWQNTPIHLVGCRVDLDKRTAGVAGAARNSPHSLVQVLLNRSPSHLWAILSNGLRLRILRDNASLTRQAYVEFDLQALMDGQVYSDFILLWLLCHQSRVENGESGVGNGESGVESGESGVGNRESDGRKTTPHSRLTTPSYPSDCWLEKWSKAAQEQGTRALDQLRGGVEQAITALGRGFLAHPANRDLRAKLHAGTLDAQDYYRQLLRLVYRLIFLFVAEDRGLIFDPNSPAAARDRYTRYYSTARLRTQAERRRGTRHADLYCGLRLVMQLLGGEGGESGMGSGESGMGSRESAGEKATHHSPLPTPASTALGLSTLGGFLFSPEAVQDLAACELANHDLLDAIRSLAFTTDRSARRGVDYKNLGSEELGSVYESLLELHPILNSEAHTFELKTAGGNERKTTGSFYTPTSLINVLLDSALDPVINERLAAIVATPFTDHASRVTEQEQAILNLKICDPASGSGHFLIAAAHRTARRLAALRTGDEEPAPEALRAALRDVIAHCIYGVDINPMAVELCKVNLWMEALEPGKPLSFLDAHIKCGNSLIGVMPGLDTSEIPDEAFNAVTGDDKPSATKLKKRNKVERTGQMSLRVTVLETPEDLARWAAERSRSLNAMPEDDVAQVNTKGDAYRQYLASQEYARLKLEADLWTAAFFWKIEKEGNGEWGVVAPTQSELNRVRSGERLDPDLVRGVQALADDEQLRFFHWGQQFPEVFEQGGFDCVLSNPPWERIKLQEEEFFAARDPQIATAANKAARQKLIAALPKKNAALAVEFESAKHAAEATSKFVRESKRFPLTAVGDVNTYAIFAEHTRKLLNGVGRTGIILPTGIATDDSTKAYFADLVDKQSLAQLYGFENEALIFPAVHHAFKFCAFTITGEDVKIGRTDYVFFARYFEHLREDERHFALSRDDIGLINPNTRTCPIFRTKADAQLTRRIYTRVPVLVNEATEESPWGVRFLAMFHMANDSNLFKNEPGNDLLPLYEAKMMHQFDHRWATFEGTVVRDVTAEEKCAPHFRSTPRYWVAEAEVEKRLSEWRNVWLIGFRNICRATDERTAIFSIIPRLGVGHSAPLMLITDDHLATSACLVGCVSALVFDYVVRQKVGGINMTFSYIRQFPVLPPTAYSTADIEFITSRVVELTYTAWDMKPFAEDMGYHGEPFRWDEERRAHLRAELDAYYARLYGLTRDELRYILDPTDVCGEDFPGETFRVLKEKEIRLYGEYRTRRLVLEKWDEQEKSKK